MDTEHKHGRIAADACPTGKHVYEDERFAVAALRYSRNHGIMRQRQGSVYSCRARGVPLHWHITGARKERRKK